MAYVQVKDVWHKTSQKGKALGSIPIAILDCSAVAVSGLVVSSKGSGGTMCPLCQNGDKPNADRKEYIEQRRAKQKAIVLD